MRVKWSNSISLWIFSLWIFYYNLHQQIIITFSLTAMQKLNFLFFCFAFVTLWHQRCFSTTYRLLIANVKTSTYVDVLKNHRFFIHRCFHFVRLFFHSRCMCMWADYNRMWNMFWVNVHFQCVCVRCGKIQNVTVGTAQKLVSTRSLYLLNSNEFRRSQSFFRVVSST